MRKNIFKNIAILFALAFGSVWTPTNHVVAQGSNAVSELQSVDSGRQTDRIIVKYKTDAEPSESSNDRVSPMEAPQEPQMSRLEDETGVELEYVRPLSSDDNAHVLQLPERLPEDQVEALSAELMNLPEVEYAEPDSIRYPVLTPNDTDYAVQQWNLYGPWGINAEAAWDITTGNSNVVIAVLDTGIVDTHEDLNDRVVNGDDATYPGFDFIDLDYFGGSYLPLTANDTNGIDSDANDPGDWVTAAESSQVGGFFQGCGESASTWHGTHVAGIIGAESDNGIGVAGIDWNARILPVRVLGKCGGYISDIADGMRWAAGLTVSGVPANLTPAKIINLSLGGDGACSTTEQNAINAATTAGAVVVVASGNENYDLDVTQSSPANCNGVITVGATDENGERSSFSNYGSTVEISAPGDNIYSASDSGLTVPDNDNAYVDKSGTSMAAPHVSGVLGLMFDANPFLTPAHASAILQSTAKDFPGGGTCNTSDCGAGIVDAAAAVQGAEAVDLIVTDYQLVDLGTGLELPSMPDPDVPFSVNVDVKNQGGTVTDSVVWGYVFIDVDPETILDVDGCVDLDSLTALEDYFFKRDLNDTLAAGASAVIKVDIENGLPAGDHQLYPYVDASCFNTEFYEDNNGYDPIQVGVDPPPPSGPTDIDITIGGIFRGQYHLEPGENEVVKYGFTAGPVEISSNNGVGIIASLNQWRRQTASSPWTGVAQSMALPVELITNKYVMPRYVGNDPTLYNAILIANVDTVSRDINVTIGGTAINETITLGPSGSKFVVYNGIVGGPIVVSSDDGAKIVASLYELKRGGTSGGWNGQSEMMGLPYGQLSDKYLIPIYFGNPIHIALDARLFIANADTVSRDITVKIGGTTMGTYTLPPNTSQVLKYPLNGAVEISGPPGSKIIASLNQWRRQTASSPWIGVAQSMALPVELITNKYVMPRYVGNDPTLYNAILIANVDTVSRDINVTIGGTAINETITLGPSGSKFVVYNGIVGGPIVVSSDDGAKIVASLYELKRGGTSGGWNGQSEMMGLPYGQLSDKYLIPIYFGDPIHIALDARLFIAVP